MLDAITDADLVVLPPSNPVVSVGTILGVPRVREALRATRAPVVGLSPIVGGTHVRGMAQQLLTSIGVPVSAAGVGAALRRPRPPTASSTAGWSTTSTPPLVPQVRAAGIACRAVPC